MVGLELRFHVSADRSAAVHRELATATARTNRVRCQYFDTPGRRLAEVRLELRLQQSDGGWVQTLKSRADARLPRLENNSPVGGSHIAPQLDIALYSGTPTGDDLAAALGKEAAALQLVCETDMRCTSRVLRSAGAAVEVTLERGQIRAADKRLPACELRFKLRTGPASGLVTLASRWIDRHALWLDVRSVAERGDYLSRGIDAGPAVQARNPVLEGDMPADAALRAIVRTCIGQVLPNAAQLAAGVGGPEHVHQTRVGLRRLRSALRVFGDWSVAVEAAWSPALAQLFAQLGTARDRDVITDTLLPELRAAGAPYTELPPESGKHDAGEALRSPQCSKLLVELLAFALGGAAQSASSAGAQETPLVAMVRPRLKRMYRQLMNDSAGFLSLDDAMRHRTRKRLKRLRYCVEFVASLYDAKAVRRYLARLRPTQDVLGQLNDLSVADVAFRKQVERDARAWFAIGCLAAHRMQLLKDAALALESLVKAPRFW
jgi:triphosphatase